MKLGYKQKEVINTLLTIQGSFILMTIDYSDNSIQASISDDDNNDYEFIKLNMLHSLINKHIFKVEKIQKSLDIYQEKYRLKDHIKTPPLT